MRWAKPINFILLILFVFIAAGAFQAVPAGPPSDNKPGHSVPAQGKNTLVILYPSLDTIKDLLGLKDKGLIDIPNLRVLGVYHEKELTDYQKAQDYVRANSLDWITFHPVSGPLAPDNLFKRNSCSAEFEKIFKESDGIIFFGGPDIPPSLYGEKTSLLIRIEDPYRHFFELSFAFHLLGGTQDPSFKPLLESRPRYPILGICLGSQTLNVATGGTLTQDIWSEIYGQTNLEDVIGQGEENWHESPFARLFPKNDYCSFHPIKLKEEGKFCAVFGFSGREKPYIFSSHHQQAEKLGRGFRVIATSLDGKIVEAMEHERYPNVLAVQFHPEALKLYDAAALIRFTPEEKERVNPRTFLEAHPPSLSFHQKLWSWFSQNLTGTLPKGKGPYGDR
jgi:putative glutamine amidotransferase